MKSLKYLCVQPRLLYYAWQVEVMINNFLKFGINPNDIIILVAYNPDDLTSSKQNIEAWEKLTTHYSNVNFFFYLDTREKPIKYIPSIRPNIIKQHFLAHPEIKNDVIFYHDCDIVFTKSPGLERYIYDDVWYLSDTNSYINYQYVISKGDDIYDTMCQIVGIDPVIPKLMNDNSGGAQYILKNTDYEFWEKVEKDAERLFDEITQMNNLKKRINSSYHELQIWCSDMWSVLWNAWLKGNQTKVDKCMDFCWATDPKERWDSCAIYHNAGVVSNGGGLFFKGNYMDTLPYNIKAEDYNENSCSYRYVKEIIYTSKISCLK